MNVDFGEMSFREIEFRKMGQNGSNFIFKLKVNSNKAQLSDVLLILVVHVSVISIILKNDLN